MLNLRFLCMGMALFCFCLGGCDKPQEVKNSKKDGNDAHAHDDGHDHSHDDHADHDGDAEEGKLGPLGPNGGHQIPFDSDDMNAEWVHYNDNDIIRVVILDPSGKENRPIKADSVTIRRTKGNDEGFALTAENPDENGATDKYMLDDKNLAIAMVLGVTVEVKMDGKTYSGKIPPHEPHSH
ncbi:MAG: hypothetical protein MK108_16870 [Mariniblastus sp.]|nr:hypothetical protein [Mariniblastus sp.]